MPFFLFRVLIFYNNMIYISIGNQGNVMEIITGKRLELFRKLAEKEKQYWDEKNKDKNMDYKQAGNTIQSCLNGIVGEFVTKLHIYKNNNPSYILDHGQNERITGIYKGKCDLEYDNKKIEVKTITKGQPQGQILPYHVDKYIKNKVDYVIFTELEYKTPFLIEGQVYLIEKPENIKKLRLMPNLKGKLCYTK